MNKCIALGKEAMRKGNPPVGSIIVKGDQIIGEGLEEAKSSKDITKHAEIEAVKDALGSSALESLEGCSLYSTHEPCIMCSYVLRQYRIETVIYGTNVDYVGGITSSMKVMETNKVPHWGPPPEIVKNILNSDCNNLTEQYIISKIK